MENVKIISDNGTEINVNGIFFIFNSKYYFIYTTGEVDENEYVKLYVVQVCKEVQNTPNGPVDTGYMLGMEISNPDEWHKTQEAITQIVEDKKNGTVSGSIQYLPIEMLVNLKVISKNKFRLVRSIVQNNFNVNLMEESAGGANETVLDNLDLENNNINSLQTENTLNPTLINSADEEEKLSDVIIDYRARFFEEQEKNRILQEEIEKINAKLEEIKNIIG